MGYGFYTVTIDGRERNAGYGVEAICDFPKCDKRIDRGLAYLCGQTPGETEFGCGRYFCGSHMGYRRYGRGKNAVHAQNCARCQRGKPPWPMKPDVQPVSSGTPGVEP